MCPGRVHLPMTVVRNYVYNYYRRHAILHTSLNVVLYSGLKFKKNARARGNKFSNVDVIRYIIPSAKRTFLRCFLQHSEYCLGTCYSRKIRSAICSGDIYARIAHVFSFNRVANINIHARPRRPEYRWLV